MSHRENIVWEDSENPNITAHFVRAVASLTYDADRREDFEMNIHSNLNRITHFVQVSPFFIIALVCSLFVQWAESASLTCNS